MNSTASGNSVTLAQIAERVNSSMNTVSLALRGSPRISEYTRKRIQSVSEKMGYVPNLAARHLATKKSGMIGIYAWELFDAVRIDLVNALISRLYAEKYNPILGLGGHPGPWHTSPWVATYRSLNVEALVVVSEENPQKDERFQKIPLIFIGCQPNSTLNADYVAWDRKEAAHIGINELYSKGHKKLLLGCSDKSTFGKSCISFGNEFGIDIINLGLPEVTKPKDIDALATYVQANKSPHAIIFGDTPYAVRFSQHIQQQGIKIPDDLAIISYDYFPWIDYLSVPLTTIEQPLAQTVDRSIETIIKRINEPSLPKIHTVLSHKLILRKST